MDFRANSGNVRSLLLNSITDSGGFGLPCVCALAKAAAVAVIKVPGEVRKVSLCLLGFGAKTLKVAAIRIRNNKVNRTGIHGSLP